MSYSRPFTWHPRRKPLMHSLDSQALKTPEPFKMQINPGILTSPQYQLTRTLSVDEAWRMYAPPPTLGATPEVQAAMDDHLQGCGYGRLITHAINLGMGFSEIAPQFLGYAYLAGLQQNGLLRAGVSTVAEDMTKKWVELKRGDADAGQDDKLKDIATALEDFGLQGIFNEAAQKCGYDGGCLVFIDTGEPDDRLEHPLYLDPLLWGDKRIRRFTLVEAINVYPNLYNAADPLNHDYFNPTQWLVLGKKVHRSRFLYFAPNKVNILLRPAYNFFGIPDSQLALDYIAHFTKTREAAMRLLTKFSLTVFKSDMSAILTGGDGANFDLRMQYLAQWRDNDSILAIDQEREDVIKLETPIAGVTDVVRQALEFVAAIFRIPFVKFLGISPGGLNATGESDLRNYYDHIDSKQQKVLMQPLTKCLDLVQLHLYGEIDPEVKAHFCPLSDEDDAQRAMTQKTKADTLAVLLQSGLIWEEEGRQALKDDPNSEFGFIDPEDIPEQAGMGGVGVPGEEGGETTQEEFEGGLAAGEGYNAASE